MLLSYEVLAGCSSAAGDAIPPPAAPERFMVASPSSGDTVHRRQYVGEVRAVRHAEVRSRLQGIIEAVSVDEGQRVDAGQLLFTISAREAREALTGARALQRSAKAELELAQIEQENTRLLFDKDVVSGTVMALARAKVASLAAKVEEAAAAVSRAEVALGYATVRAPFAGVVHRLPRRIGSVVDEGELLTTLSDASEVFVYFRVSEREYLEHSQAAADGAEQQARLVLADGSAHETTGLVDAVEGEIDRETGNIAFRARFANPDGRLKHGSSGTIVLEQSLTNALLVPQKSTFEVQGNLYVYVVDEANRARARQIVPSVRLDDHFVVASGLTTGDRFVLEGVQKLRDGLQIEVEPSS